MKEIKVLAFGVVAEILGKNNFVMSNVTSTDNLKAQLEKDFPALKNKSFAIAVNKQIVTESTSLEANATVALLPPFSGG